MINIGEKIKELRIEKGLLQKDLAINLGVARNTITQYENNVVKPSYEILVCISKYFDVTTDFLLGIEDEIGRKNTKINNITKSFNNFDNKNGNFKL